MITYKKMSLFDAPAESAIMHDCNALGIWASGIAKDFNQRFPKTFKEYNRYCTQNEQNPVGTVIVGFENDFVVGNLITSYGYGKEVDPPEEILKNTEKALHEFFEYLEEEHITKVYCNKFNSGLFKVPWEDTEKLLEKAGKAFGVRIIVCVPDME
jgi:ADP-ribose 1''-phosphate phosphatase